MRPRRICWCALLVALGACGRLHFERVDAQDPDGGGGTDGSVDGSIDVSTDGPFFDRSPMDDATADRDFDVRADAQADAADGAFDSGSADAEVDAGPAPSATYLGHTILGGPSQDIAFAFAMNAAGAHAIAGGAGVTADLGNGESTAEEGTFVTAFEPDGRTRWVRRVGGTGTDRANGVRIDESGRVFIVGEFRPELDLGGGVLPNEGSIDGFAAAFDEAGAHLWSAAGGSGLGDLFHHSEPVADGMIMVGNMNADARFGSELLPAVGGTDGVLVRYDGAGDPALVRSLGVEANDELRGVGVRSDGLFYVAGFRANAALDAVLICLNADGTILWERMLTGDGNSRFFAVDVDAADHAYVVGHYAGATTFGSMSLPDTDGSDLFIARVSSEGVVSWITFAGGAPDELAHGVEVSGTGVYVSGTHGGPFDWKGVPITGSTGAAGAYVARLDASDGSLGWHQVIEGASLLGIGVSSAGLVAAGGYFDDSFVPPDGIPVTGFGGRDVLVVRFQQ